MTDFVTRIVESGKYSFPFKPKREQRDEVNKLLNSHLNRAGYYWGMGAGKTFGTTLHTCQVFEERGSQVIQICPPILLHQWSKWLTKCGISNKVYSGTPAQRRAITFDRNTRYFVMSSGILKKDFTRIQAELGVRAPIVVVDEATCIKNYESGNFLAVLQMGEEGGVIPATGTPLSTPADAYAYVKLVSPGLYRSYQQFENIHVRRRDGFGRPIEWEKLDLLSENLKKRGSFMSTAAANPDMPLAHVQEVEYKLSPDHKKLYNKLVDQQLLVYDNGATIDATTPNKMYQAIQQIVVNYAYYSQQSELKPSSFELLDEYLRELAPGEKMLVFATYNMSITAIVNYLKAKGIKCGQVNGQVSDKVKLANVEEFKDDPSYQVLVMHPESGGYGVDGLQLVCNRMIFLEIPTVPRTFWQAVARLERPGQRFVTDVRIATALGTVQVRLLKNLTDADTLVRQVIPSPNDLRAQLLGLA